MRPKTQHHKHSDFAAELQVLEHAGRAEVHSARSRPLSARIEFDPDFAQELRDIAARGDLSELRCEIEPYDEGYFTQEQLEELSEATAARLTVHDFTASCTPQEMLKDSYVRDSLNRLAADPEAHQLSPGQAGPTVLATAFVLFKLARAWGAASGRIAVPTSNTQARRAIYRHLVDDPASAGSQIEFGALSFRRNKQTQKTHQQRIAPEQTYRRARKLLERVGYVFSAVAHTSGPDRCIAVLLPELPQGATVDPTLDLPRSALERCLSGGQQFRMNLQKQRLATPHVNKLKDRRLPSRRPGQVIVKPTSSKLHANTSAELQIFTGLLEKSLVRKRSDFPPVMKLFLGAGQEVEVDWQMPAGPIRVEDVSAWACSQFVFSASSLREVHRLMLATEKIMINAPNGPHCSTFYDITYLFNSKTQGPALQREIDVLVALSSRRHAMNTIMNSLVKTANRSAAGFDFLPKSLAFLFVKLREEIRRVAITAVPTSAQDHLHDARALDERQRSAFRQALRKSGGELFQANLSPLSLTGQNDVLLLAGDHAAWRRIATSESEHRAVYSACEQIGAKSFYFAGPGRHIGAQRNFARAAALRNRNLNL